MCFCGPKSPVLLIRESIKRTQDYKLSFSVSSSSWSLTVGVLQGSVLGCLRCLFSMWSHASLTLNTVCPPQFISLPWSLRWAPGSYPSAYPTSLFRSPVSISDLRMCSGTPGLSSPDVPSSLLSGPLSCSGQNLEVVFDFSLCFLTHIQSIGGLRCLPFKIYAFAAIAPTATLV